MCGHARDLGRRPLRTARQVLTGPGGHHKAPDLVVRRIARPATTSLTTYSSRSILAV
jgi:hypothetical protein